jgi:type IV pilus assembly protein PilC
VTTYAYVAFDNKTGKEIKGSLDADNEFAARNTLKSEGKIPTEVGEASMLNKEIEFSLFQKVKVKDLATICRQFVSILKAGIPLTEALRMLEEQTEKKHLAKALADVRIEVEKGEPLSSAMGLNSAVFPDIMINMVAAGEASGSLETSFKRLAIQFEKDQHLKGIMKKAMIYPVIVTIVAIAVMIVLLVVVIPRFMSVFDQLGEELPTITKVVVGISGFITGYWYLLVILIVGIAIGIKTIKNTEEGAIWFGTRSAHMPLFGKLIVKNDCSRFARTMSTLLYAGMPLVDALEITQKLMANAIYKKAVGEVADDVMKGVDLSEAIKASKVFPALVVHMVRVGSETGDVEGMLDQMADYYDEEVEMTVSVVMAAIAPLIIVVLAFFVVIIIASIMAPMLQLYDSMGSV